LCSQRRTRIFKLTDRQVGAFSLLAGPQRYTLLYGGTRSTKTFTIMRAILMRAMKSPASRHLVARYRRNAVISTVVLQTLPVVRSLCFPGVDMEYNKQEGILRLPNLAEVWFDGLDDKDRVEKILGTEFVTTFFNEASQIPYATYQMVRLRTAQVVDEQYSGGTRKQMQRVYVDENPPSTAHWTYSLFFKHIDPDSRRALTNPDQYRAMRLNPADNAENLSQEFLTELKTASTRYRKRFYDGEFSDTDASALWRDETFDRYRIIDEKPPDYQRVVIAVDPSGADDENNESNDGIGIVVVALGTNGQAYVLEDLTLKAGPATWGKVVGTAFDRHQADRVVAETNFGGAMVKSVIHAARAGTPYTAVTASRGKVIRAEPVSALYEDGKVHHVGYFPELESELCDFTTTGYKGSASPNRADALVWAISELFPAITKPKDDWGALKYDNKGIV